jgi:hypothetical protein
MTDEGHPIHYTAVERRTPVYAADGTEVGKVHEVIGDAGTDIFNGLAVSPGHFRGSRYVPSERVDRIEEGVVYLTLSPAQFEQLDEAAPMPPSERIRADTTDL